MKLNIHEIEEVAKHLAYDEPAGALNELLVHGDVRDYELPEAAQVQVDYYRAGEEVFFRGHISGSVVGHCARCLEEYPFKLSTDFSVVLVPKRSLPAEVELTDQDLDLGYYEGDQIDLSPLVHEQIIVALPTRPLCRPECKGLCANCGADLNTEVCRCAAPAHDGNLRILTNAKGGH